jgi:uncharacterized repeat protein (TIGR01451 family)
VQRSADLSITKTDSRNQVSTGSPLQYTIEVTNDGPSVASSVEVTDVLPSSLQFVTGSSTLGTVNNDGNAVTVDIDQLNPGQTATITLDTIVVGSDIGTITNTADVSAAEPDPDESNNAATEETDLVSTGLSKRLLLASTPQ